jgi:LysR family transcriptional regulator, benzoate and cis,cis-muconate-responsive activator of ben and cat genes
MDEMKEAMRVFVSSNRPRFVVGFVPSVLYARLPEIIRGFRRAAPEVDLTLTEMITIEQIAALKEGRIDFGFGRVRFDDPAIEREVLREEELVAALPIGHRLLSGDRPIDLADLSDEAVIIYPREPRPSYADQVLSLLRDQGVTPEIVHEVRELQTALGLVAAEDGVCIVPASVHLLARPDIVFRKLAQRAVSPIIISHRKNDSSPHVASMIGVIVALYKEWGWPLPGRFAREIGCDAYLGLVPRRYQSGEVDYVGGISKCGDRRVRTLLYEAANVMLTRYKSQLKLKDWAFAIAKRSTMRKARIALARRLGIIMHAMLRDGTEFASA